MVEAYKWRDEMQWLHTRYIATMIHNTSVSKKMHQKKPSQLVPLEIDGPNAYKPPLEIDHHARWKKFLDDLKKENPEQLDLLLKK